MTSPSKSHPQLHHGHRNRYAEVQFAPIRAMETDDSGAISPPLWRNRSPSPSRPLLGGSFSPDSRAQAIARGRSELMEMVRHMPESSYELSLKDIVEHHHRAENQIEGGSDRRAAGSKKEESRKIERRLSFEDKGFFLNMAFPFAFMSKRKKKTVVVVGGGSGSGRVSPKPEGWKGGGERDWWKKKFTGSSDSDSSRTSNNSGGSSTATATTTTSRGSSDSGGRRKIGFTTGCWQFFQLRRTKSA
ncbi:hypothetical protein AAHA92_20695 [Salvia divinorum]|uniref:Uncharacterized protein n=1 Tax=Salvia divinorum TaxID=28513 RepID=A0ABD1GLD7_SALDI